VTFAERVDAGGTELALSGLGLLRYRVVFKAYVAALYLEPGSDPERVLEDVPKRLEIEYFWSISAEDIARAGDELLRRNLDDETWQSLADRVARLNALYRDVEPGDRYALTYVPGRGTELAKNGTPLGTVPGADFAEAYFGIWLGEQPLDASLARQLLSGG